MSNLTIFGSARMDAFLKVPQEKASQVCSVDHRKCVIELSYGEKIPLDSVSFHVGGNGANVAIGTKRLGLESILVAELGQGPMADLAFNTLSKEIDMKHVMQTEGADQGFGAIISYMGERTILSYYSPKEPVLPVESCESEWVYLTSTGESFENYFEKIYQTITSCGSKVAFNPGGRQIAKGKEWLDKYLKITEILFVNREEGEKILGWEEKSYEKEKDLLSGLVSLGPKCVIVTDGTNGAYATKDNAFFKIPTMQNEAVERTGAGDAFSTGFLSATILGKDLREALLWGTINSNSVIGQIGPQGGLLDINKMEEWLVKAKNEGVEAVEL